MIKSFKVGQSCSAYCDPENPSDAYLIPRWSFWPCMFLLVPTVLLMLMPLMSKHYLRQLRRPFYRAFCILWPLLGGFAATHYFVFSEPPYPLYAIISTAIYAFIWLVLVVFALRKGMKGDDLPPFFLGSP